VTGTPIFNLFQNETDTRRYDAGSVIFAAEEVGDCFYVVREGIVALTADGRELEQVGPGGIFGELALLDQAPRSAGATALTDCEVIPIDERRFMFLVGQTPFFALTVMRVMSARLRRASATPA
jgi:CRP-like cAMP-binding protein